MDFPPALSPRLFTPSTSQPPRSPRSPSPRNLHIAADRHHRGCNGRCSDLLHDQRINADRRLHQVHRSHHRRRDGDHECNCNHYQLQQQLHRVRNLHDKSPAAATPTFSVAAGTYASVQTVSISDATTGSSIYYTIDGSTPSVGGGTTAPYTGPITVAVSTTINAIAVAAPDYNLSAVGSAAYIINLPATSFTITSANSTITVPPGGSATATLTLTANASFNGSISFACAHLPIGATCTFSPTSVALVAQGNSTTTLTVSVPATTAALHHGPGPLLPGSMLAAVLSLLGFRKRCRLQLVLLVVLSGVGLTMFSGCTTTSSSTSSSSQIAVTATGASCPV